MKGKGIFFMPLGSVYAVHTFLEKYCGVRWYMPGELGTVIPKKDEIVLGNIDLKTKPWTRYRFSSRSAFREPFKFYGWKQPDELVHLSARDTVLWMLRMKIGGGVFACNHSFSAYYNRFGEQHPEWWKEGKPTNAYPHPDYANEDLIKQITQDAVEYFSTGKKYPGAMAAGNYFASMPNDGRKALIWSEAGEKLRDNDPEVQKGFSCGWASDFVFSMISKVAAAVRTKFPDKWITCACYGPYFMPPRHIKAFEPNIAIQNCGFLTRAFDKNGWEFETGNLTAWNRLVNQIYVWEYYLVQSEAQFKAFPVIYPRHIAKSMNFLKETDIRGMFFEASAAPSAGGPYTDATLANPAEDLLNHYITWKFLCDNSMPVENVLDEFYRLFFGPAEAPMREFFNLIESRWVASADVQIEGMTPGKKYWEVMCDPGVLKKLEGRMRQAISLAKESPYKERVELMYLAVYKRAERNFMDHQYLYSSRQRITAVDTEENITVDGMEKEPAWFRSRKSNPFVSSENLPASVETSFRTLRDKDNLYLYVECPEPQIAKMPEAKNDADYVEIAIDAGRTREKYFLIRVPLAGDMYDSVVEGKKEDANYKSEAKTAVLAGKNGWTVEVAVPFSTMVSAPPVEGEVWGLDVARFRGQVSATGAEPQTTMWMPTFGSLNNPDEFGILEFRTDAGKPGEMNPVMWYDFEGDFIAIKAVQDTAGVQVKGMRQFSSGLLKTSAGGANWDSSNVAEGIKGQGIRFKGDEAKEYLEVKLADAVNLSQDDFSVSFWLKAEKTKGVIFSSTTSAPYWQLWFADYGRGTHPCFSMNSGSGKPTSLALFADALFVKDGNWHHYALVVDRGRNVRLYVDGNLAGDSKMAQHKGPLKKVLTVGGPYNYLEGVMDELMIFQGCLDQAQIKSLYHAFREDLFPLR